MNEFPIRRVEISEFPELAKIRKPPRELFIQGSERGYGLLTHLPEQGLAVVGTRQCQSRSQNLIRSVLRELSGFDLIILSGLAYGTDGAAHSAALEAGLPTIAILGCAIDQTYPPEHTEIRQRILESDGLIISEYPPDAVTWASHFHDRNRLIAGWAKATWVVQAPYRSGALNTAMHARKEERDVYATPTFPGDPAFLGTQKLLQMTMPATPIYSARCFSKTWIGLDSFLSARQVKKARRLHADEPMNAVLLLHREVKRQSRQNSGVSISSLHYWGRENGWSDKDFFETLQRAIDQNRVVSSNGIVSEA